MKDGPKRTARFYLIRHGETDENVRMSYLGTTDEPLNENGNRQARLTADALAQLPIVRVVSSPMRRASATAALIQEACNAQLLHDSRLAEGSFGKWEGRTRSEVLELGDEDAKALVRWESDPSCSPPGGESIVSVRQRIVNLAEELTGECPGSSVVLVSHVGPIKALLSAVLDIPLQSTRRFFLDPASITVVEWGDHPVLRLFNSHAHLGWTKARWMK